MIKKGLTIIGIFAVLLVSLMMVSAVASKNDVTISFNQTTIDNAVNGEEYQIDITIENLNSIDYNVTLSNNNWDFVPASQIVTGNSNKSFIGTYIISSHESSTVTAEIFEEGNPSVNFTIDEKLYISHADDEKPVPNPTPVITKNSACVFEYKENENGTLKINDFDIVNNGKGDDTDWEYMDKLEIEVEIKNKDKDDAVRDVEVRLMILDKDGDDVTDDFDLKDDVITSIGKLKDGDSETVVFDLVVPSDIDAGDYKMYILAYSDGNIDEQCVSIYDDKDFKDDLYYEFSVVEVKYKDAIVVDEFKLGLFHDTYCGGKLELTVPVYNLYDKDEDKVLVWVHNSKLNIDEMKVINDLRKNRNKDVSLTVNVPEGLEKDGYDLYVTVFFDWDDKEDEYNKAAYDESNEYPIKLKIIECKGPVPSINPTLESEMKKGSELVVKALITNNDKDSDFEISINGYEDWADVVSVTPKNAHIAKGEFVETTVVLMPKKSGTRSFNIATTVNGETYNQPIRTSIKNNFTLSDIVKNPLYLILTIGIIVSVLMIILILIIKSSRRKPIKPQF